jgi:hypothetical protein
MRAKLREIKQQIRERMHDPVRQTGQWLKSIVQGHFNYYAVPGNLDSLGVFRDRIMGHWWRTLRRRSQKRSHGRVFSPWLTDGSLNRESSILTLLFALPPVIRDKNRMR